MITCAAGCLLDVHAFLVLHLAIDPGAKGAYLLCLASCCSGRSKRSKHPRKLPLLSHEVLRTDDSSLLTPVQGGPLQAAGRSQKSGG